MKINKPDFWKKNNLVVYLLWPLSFFTNIFLILKNKKNSYSSKINTICVGNIYLGGTGKTSLVIKIHDILKKKFNFCN